MTTIQSIHDDESRLEKRCGLMGHVGAGIALVTVCLLGAVLLHYTLGNLVGPLVDFLRECAEGWDVFIHSLGAGNIFCGP